MQKKHMPIHIGLRTVKTAVAVIIAMLIVDSHGASSSKLVFAMLGVMAAVQPTFEESVNACIGQIISVQIGSMPYALERMWDTAIGLAVGFTFNTLILPYNNSKKIVATIEGLERELIWFLEHLFDDDDVIPDAEVMMKKVDAMDQQLSIFSRQKLVLHLRRQKQELETYRICERKARELVARMEVLSSMGRPGRLDEENRQRLISCGARIRDERVLDSVLERDVVTNYHVRQILRLRRELLAALEKSQEDTAKRRH